MRLAVLLFSLFTIPAVAQTTAGLQWHGESAALRDGRVFALPDGWRTIPLHSGKGGAYLRMERHGTVFEGEAQWQAAEGRMPETKGRLNELYADFSASGLDFTVGKKVIGSGIGYGFRPLDVIEQEDRRRLFAGRLEGVPLIAVERFGIDSAETMVYFNRFSLDHSGMRRGDHQLAMRDYRLWGDTETVLLLHLHERTGAAVGGGFTWVGGESLELHGAVLYQPRLLRRRHALLDDTKLLADTDPWREVEGRGDGRALIGLTWSHVEGYTLVMEAWHDSAAMSRDQWRALFSLAAQQRALLGGVPDAVVYGNLAWDTAAYQSQSLLRDNLLLRLNYDGDKADPYLDLLSTPADRGWSVTMGLDYELAQGLTLSGGARAFGGPPDSAYGQLPERGIGFLELHGEIVW